MSMQPRSCECFSLCGDHHLAWFHMHLPVVRSTESPWYKYLLTVYHQTSLTLPVNMKRFELFWPNLLPTAMYLCSRAQDDPTVPVLPQCPASQCVGWLNISGWNTSTLKPQKQPAVRAFVRRYSFVFTPSKKARSSNIHTEPAANHAAKAGDPWSQFALIQVSDRKPQANHTWVEVIRVDRYARELRPTSSAHRCYPWTQGCQIYVDNHLVQLGHVPGCARSTPPCCEEGRGYGCWFWAARGSGIFANTLNTLHVSSHSAAKSGAFGLRTTVAKAHWETTSKKALELPHAQGPPFALHALHPAGDARYDGSFANVTRRLGAESLQILHGNSILFQAFTRSPREFVIASDSCMRSQTRIRACPPIPLRTGWKADQECKCQNSGHLVMQCGKKSSNP